MCHVGKIDGKFDVRKIVSLFVKGKICATNANITQYIYIYIYYLLF